MRKRRLIYRQLLLVDGKHDYKREKLCVFKKITRTDFIWESKIPAILKVKSFPLLSICPHHLFRYIEKNDRDNSNKFSMKNDNIHSKVYASPCKLRILNTNTI